MTPDEFARAFESELQLPARSLSPSSRLNDVGRFDSMGRLTFMSWVDTQFNRTIDPDRLSACETVDDLRRLIES